MRGGNKSTGQKIASREIIPENLSHILYVLSEKSQYVISMSNHYACLMVRSFFIYSRDIYSAQHTKALVSEA